MGGISAKKRAARERQQKAKDGLLLVGHDPTGKSCVQLAAELSALQGQISEIVESKKEAVKEAFMKHVPTDAFGAPLVSPANAAKAAEIVPVLVAAHALGNGHRLSTAVEAKMEAKEAQERADEAEQMVQDLQQQVSQLQKEAEEQRGVAEFLEWLLEDPEGQNEVMKEILKTKLYSRRDDLTYTEAVREMLARTRTRWRSAQGMEFGLRQLFEFLVGGEWPYASPTRKTISASIKQVAEVRLKRVVDRITTQDANYTLSVDESKTRKRSLAPTILTYFDQEKQKPVDAIVAAVDMQHNGKGVDVATGMMFGATEAKLPIPKFKHMGSDNTNSVAGLGCGCVGEINSLSSELEGVTRLPCAEHIGGIANAHLIEDALSKRPSWKQRFVEHLISLLRAVYCIYGTARTRLVPLQEITKLLFGKAFSDCPSPQQQRWLYEWRCAQWVIKHLRAILLVDCFIHYHLSRVLASAKCTAQGIVLPVHDPIWTWKFKKVSEALGDRLGGLPAECYENADYTLMCDHIRNPVLLTQLFVYDAFCTKFLGPFHHWVESEPSPDALPVKDGNSGHLAARFKVHRMLPQSRVWEQQLTELGAAALFDSSWTQVQQLQQADDYPVCLAPLPDLDQQAIDVHEETLSKAFVSTKEAFMGWLINTYEKAPYVCAGVAGPDGPHVAAALLRATPPRLLPSLTTAIVSALPVAAPGSVQQRLEDYWSRECAIFAQPSMLEEEPASLELLPSLRKDATLLSELLQLASAPSAPPNLRQYPRLHAWFCTNVAALPISTLLLESQFNCWRAYCTALDSPTTIAAILDSRMLINEPPLNIAEKELRAAMAAVQRKAGKDYGTMKFIKKNLPDIVADHRAQLAAGEKLSSKRRYAQQRKRRLQAIRSLDAEDEGEDSDEQPAAMDADGGDDGGNDGGEDGGDDGGGGAGAADDDDEDYCPEPSPPSVSRSRTKSQRSQSSRAPKVAGTKRKKSSAAASSSSSASASSSSSSAASVPAKRSERLQRASSTVHSCPFCGLRVSGGEEALNAHFHSVHYSETASEMEDAELRGMDLVAEHECSGSEDDDESKYGPDWEGVRQSSSKRQKMSVVAKASSSQDAEMKDA